MTQAALDVEIIRQYPGPVQVARRVQLKVPGKHFPNLTAAEQKEFFDGTAVEYAERHKFAQHLKAWGVAHTGPGIRFICTSDAIDDPNTSGFWTTLALWNRWRHATYKDDTRTTARQRGSTSTSCKAFPLAHRCLSLSDFRSTDVLESLLDRPREMTTVCQDTTEGYGEGIDLGMNYLMITGARDEATADCVELVSGRGTDASPEVWKETNASSLPTMFRTFRKELAAQLSKRFSLDTTPSKHVLLALKMNPAIDTTCESKQMVWESRRSTRRPDDGGRVPACAAPSGHPSGSAPSGDASSRLAPPVSNRLARSSACHCACRLASTRRRARCGRDVAAAPASQAPQEPARRCRT